MTKDHSKTGDPAVGSTRLVRCGRCRWRDVEGNCTCPKLYENGMPPEGEIENGTDHLVYSYYDGGSFWVGENFGCVHGEGSDER